MHALTLLEVLVVVTLMAILAALLFPALQGAIERSQRASCMKNLRLQGQAIFLFAAENGGRLPQQRNPSKYGGGGPFMYQQIEPYLDVGGDMGRLRKIFQCPAEKHHYPDVRGDYGANTFFVTVAGPEENYLGKPLASVPSPAKVFMLVDAKDAPGTGGFWNVHVDHIRRFGIDPGVQSQKPWPPRHGNGMNWLFFDGHVEWMTTDQVHSLSQDQRNALTGYPAP